jgi:hypothetical protein
VSETRDLVARLEGDWRENAKRARANYENAQIKPMFLRAQYFGVSQAYEQCADELLAALSSATPADRPKIDILPELHRILGAHGIASLSSRDQFAGLPDALIGWAAAACRQSRATPAGEGPQDRCPHCGGDGTDVEVDDSMGVRDYASVICTTCKGTGRAPSPRREATTGETCQCGHAVERHRMKNEPHYCQHAGCLCDCFAPSTPQETTPDLRSFLDVKSKETP